jgi:hypothetical protein
MMGPARGGGGLQNQESAMTSRATGRGLTAGGKNKS